MKRPSLLLVCAAVCAVVCAPPRANASLRGGASPRDSAAAATAGSVGSRSLRERMLAALPPQLAAAARARTTAVPPRYAPGEVLAILREDTPLTPLSGGTLKADSGPVAAILQKHGLDRFAYLYQAEPAKALHRRYLELLSSRPDFDPEAAASELRATGLFRAVIPNYYVRVLSTIPNDPLVPQQWHIHSPGGADIHLPEAWDLARGARTTTIAIMDTGVDYTHPDLAATIWTNPGEIPDNGVDDDGNGFIDDVFGWDFGGNDSVPLPEPTIDPTLGLDIGFHGTHVAGIASAVTNNGEGGAGASWGCSIMALKVSDPVTGEIPDAAVAAAFVYASDMHADVLSMSFGAPGDPGVPEFFQTLVDDATASGVLCVAAAGNDVTSTLSYPAASNGVLAVVATDETNARADFSNFGPWVDAGAPGSQILSSICQNYEIDFLSQLFYILFFGWDGVSPYMLADGTSMACPLAAGVCALVKSQVPSLSPQQLAQVIIDNGDVVPYDQPIGKKVNAFKAVQAVVARTGVEPGPTPPPPQPAGGRAIGLVDIVPNPSNPRTAIRFALARPGSVRAEVFDVAGRHVRRLLDGALQAGLHQVVWDGADQSGRTVASGVYTVRVESAGDVISGKIVLAR